MWGFTRENWVHQNWILEVHLQKLEKCMKKERVKDIVWNFCTFLIDTKKNAEVQNKKMRNSKLTTIKPKKVCACWKRQSIQRSSNIIAPQVHVFTRCTTIFFLSKSVFSAYNRFKSPKKIMAKNIESLERLGTKGFM